MQLGERNLEAIETASDPALGEHRQQLGTICLLTPTARSGWMGVR